MSNPKVTRQEIEQLAERLGGCVAAVAEAIGVSRQALYERSKRLGIDWGLYREQSHTITSEGVRSVTTVGAGPVALSVTSMSMEQGSDGQSLDDKWSDRAGDPSLQGMERGATAKVVGIAVRPRDQQPPRFTRDEADAVADFRIRYQPKLGFETNNSAIFHQYFAETFPEWAEKKMREEGR
jgi:hypothetical protein